MKTQPHNEHHTDSLTMERPSRSRRAIAWLTLIAYVGQPLASRLRWWRIRRRRRSFVRWWTARPTACRWCRSPPQCGGSFAQPVHPVQRRIERRDPQQQSG